MRRLAMPLRARAGAILIGHRLSYDNFHDFRQ
jgi:hypothetical protein